MTSTQQPPPGPAQQPTPPGPWQPQPYGPWTPPAPWQQQAPQPQPSNGVATAGFVTALVGGVLSLIPIVGIVSWLISPVGLVLSVVGLVLADRRRAGKGLAIAGTALGVFGIIMCIVYATAFAHAFSNPPTYSNPSSVSPAPSPAAIPSSAPSAAPATTAPFGTPITYPDGLSVNVSQPTTFTPSAAAAGNTGASAVRVTVTVTNGTSRPIMASTTYVTATMAGQPADAIFDTDMLGPPSSTIQPGRSITFKEGFSTASPTGELQIDVRPGFSYEPATFIGTM